MMREKIRKYTVLASTLAFLGSAACEGTASKALSPSKSGHSNLTEITETYSADIGEEELENALEEDVNISTSNVDEMDPCAVCEPDYKDVFLVQLSDTERVVIREGETKKLVLYGDDITGEPADYTATKDEKGKLVLTSNKVAVTRNGRTYRGPATVKIEPEESKLNSKLTVETEEKPVSFDVYAKELERAVQDVNSESKTALRLRYLDKIEKTVIMTDGAKETLTIEKTKYVCSVLCGTNDGAFLKVDVNELESPKEKPLTKILYLREGESVYIGMYTFPFKIKNLASNDQTNPTCREYRYLFTWGDSFYKIGVGETLALNNDIFVKLADAVYNEEEDGIIEAEEGKPVVKLEVTENNQTTVHHLIEGGAGILLGSKTLKLVGQEAPKNICESGTVAKGDKSEMDESMRKKYVEYTEAAARRAASARLRRAERLKPAVTQRKC